MQRKKNVGMEREFRVFCIHVRTNTEYINTVAGNGLRSFGGDGHQATSAAFNIPSGICVSEEGLLYIADRYNHRVRQLDLNTGSPPPSPFLLLHSPLLYSAYYIVPVSQGIRSKTHTPLRTMMMTTMTAGRLPLRFLQGPQPRLQEHLARHRTVLQSDRSLATHHAQTTSPRSV